MKAIVAFASLLLTAASQLGEAQVASDTAGSSAEKKRPADALLKEGVSCYAYRDTSSHVALQIDASGRPRGRLLSGTCRVRFYSDKDSTKTRDTEYPLIMPGGARLQTGLVYTIQARESVNATARFKAVKLSYWTECIGCSAIEKPDQIPLIDHSKMKSRDSSSRVRSNRRP